MLSKREPLLAPFVLFLLTMVVFVAALATRIAFVPDVVAIASVEGAQSLWALEAAFLLRAVEYIAGFGAILVLMAMVLQWISLRIRSPARTSRH